MTESGDTTISVTVRSTPFAGDTPFAPAFYEAIGRVVVLWGQFETHFDGDLLMFVNIARRFGIEHEMPISLSRKTTLLKRLFRDVPVLKPYLPEIKRLARDIEDSSKDRNFVLHSHAGPFLAGDPPKLELHNYQHRDGQLLISKASVTIAQLEKLAATIDSLNTRLIPFSWNLSRLQDGTCETVLPPNPQPDRQTPPMT